jgi:hypothetical protein
MAKAGSEFAAEELKDQKVTREHGRTVAKS